MVFWYDFGIWLYTLLVHIASLKNKKAAAWITGRKNLMTSIARQVDSTVQYTWFHFASLGEFEQGRSVMEQLKLQRPETRLLVTFFSPSGYEIRKNYPLADHVFYLPIDTATNAREFLALINPKMAVFTKYEYWYHYFDELHKRRIPLYVISAIFRKNQPFFQFYGSLHRHMLRCVSHFFVQNEESKQLLESISIKNVTVSGDTRFDRVFENASNPKSFEPIRAFCGNSQVLVAGSTWPEDEKLIAQLMSVNPTWKLIIAPHEVTEPRIFFLKELFKEQAICYSTWDKKVTTCNILIIDTIGMLSSIYQYGHLAYIGGGFDAGIHNTLEAAAFGLPVIFGPRYHKFQEAKDLIALGGAFSTKNIRELKSFFDTLKDKTTLTESGRMAKTYVLNHTGTTERIINFLIQFK